jgi:hypothetical protein
LAAGLVPSPEERLAKERKKTSWAPAQGRGEFGDGLKIFTEFEFSIFTLTTSPPRI